jgi:hypothetical protein
VKISDSVYDLKTGGVFVELRKYSPVNDTVLQDNTIVILITKAFVPSGKDPGNILVEAIHLAPFPGNPKDPNYVNSVLDFLSPAVFAQGTVCGEQSRESTGMVTFPTTVSDYVGGGKQTDHHSVHNLATVVHCVAR